MKMLIGLMAKESSILAMRPYVYHALLTDEGPTVCGRDVNGYWCEDTIELENEPLPKVIYSGGAFATQLISICQICQKQYAKLYYS